MNKNLIKLLLTAVLTLGLLLTLCFCKKTVVTDPSSQTGETANNSTDTITTNVPDVTQTPDTTDVPSDSESQPDDESSVPEDTKDPIDTQMKEFTFDAPSEIYKSLCTYMEIYPNLEVLNVENVVLTAEEYVNICDINPDVRVVAKVQFEDEIIDLSSNEIDLSGVEIADKEAFDKLISRFPSGVKLVMCDCGYSNEEMAALREKYPELEFAWRIYMGKWNLRTDDEAFSVMIFNYNYKRLTSADIEVLRYCTNLYALDLGHQALTDLTVIGELTDLRVLILADNQITDVTPLANLKKLEYLELFVNRISDISPVAACTELVDLNFGWNYGIKDISGIYSLEKLERLWLPTTNIAWQTRAEITENFPGVKIIFADKDSVSSGWRTHERYYSMRGMFTNNKYDENFIKDN